MGREPGEPPRSQAWLSEPDMEVREVTDEELRELPVRSPRQVRQRVPVTPARSRKPDVMEGRAPLGTVEALSAASSEAMAPPPPVRQEEVRAQEHGLLHARIEGQSVPEGSARLRVAADLAGGLEELEDQAVFGGPHLPAVIHGAGGDLMALLQPLPEAVELRLLIA